MLARRITSCAGAVNRLTAFFSRLSAEAVDQATDTRPGRYVPEVAQNRQGLPRLHSQLKQRTGTTLSSQKVAGNRPRVYMSGWFMERAKLIPHEPNPEGQVPIATLVHWAVRDQNTRDECEIWCIDSEG